MRRVICLLLLFFLSSIAIADLAFSKRQDVQNFITYMVTHHSFNRQELLSTMEKVVLQPQVIASMNSPYEKKTWDSYKQLFITPERIQKGMYFWHANQAYLAEAEKKYGVPPQVIVAIIGIETLYGQRQGNYRVLDALATLAFNYPKRSEFFTKELAQYLLLCREQGVPPTQYLGSYAGAMGKPQFMPSSYRQYATNFNGSRKKDLINDNEAVIASVANYFHKHGWRVNQGIAQPAQVKGSRYKKLNTTYKTANYGWPEVTAAGITPITASHHTPPKVGLIELNTTTGAEYWLAYPNFYVITRYNTSPQYAMAVYLLSQQLKMQWAVLHKGKDYAYV